MPFARLPRLERLRVQGKADEAEDGDVHGDDGENDDHDGENGKRVSKEEREKKKMRGKSKSMKRYVAASRRPYHLGSENGTDALCADTCESSGRM